MAYLHDKEELVTVVIGRPEHWHPPHLPPIRPQKEGKVVIERSKLKWPQVAGTNVPVPISVPLHVVDGEVEGEVGVAITNRVGSAGPLVIRVVSRERAPQGRQWVIFPGQTALIVVGSGKYSPCTYLGLGVTCLAQAIFARPGRYFIYIASGKVRRIGGRLILIKDDEIVVETFATGGIEQPAPPPGKPTPPPEKAPEKPSEAPERRIKVKDVAKGIAVVAGSIVATSALLHFIGK